MLFDWCCCTGHAIYSLDASKEHIQNSTRTLLEEPRAELTAMLTLRLLQKQGYISEASPV